MPIRQNSPLKIGFLHYVPGFSSISTAQAGGTVKLEPVLFNGILLLSLIPFWVTDYFLTQDGPIHLYNARILLDWFNGNGVDFYQPYYLINERISPNWFTSLLLIAFSSLAGFAIGHQILLSVYQIGFAWAFRYMVRSISKESSFFSLLAFPLSGSLFLHYGFYNFCLSFIFFFLITGVLVKSQGNFSLKTSIWLFLYFVFLYIAHPVSYVMAVALMGLLVLVYAADQTWLSDQQKPFLLGWIQQTLRKTPAILAILLPTMLLFVYFLITSEGTDERATTGSIPNLIKKLLVFDNLISFSSAERLLIGLLGLVLLSLAGSVLWEKYRSRQLSQGDWLLLVAVLFVLVYLAAPSRLAGGSVIKPRMPLYVYIALIVWLAYQVYPSKIRIWGLWALSAVAIGLILVRLPIQLKLDRYVKEYRTVLPYINDQSTVLSINYAYHGESLEKKQISPILKIFSNMQGFLGIDSDKQLILLDNYQARTSYFPVRWQEERNPYRHISKSRNPNEHTNGISDYPACGDFDTYPERTGASVDYVVIWGDPSHFGENSCVLDTERQLAEGYEKIYTSPNSLVQLYKKRSFYQ